MIAAAQRLLSGLAPPLRSVHVMFHGLAPFEDAATVAPVIPSGGMGIRRRQRRKPIEAPPPWPDEFQPPGIPEVPAVRPPIIPVDLPHRGRSRARRRREEILLIAIGRKR